MSRSSNLPGIDPDDISSFTGFPISRSTLKRLVRDGQLHTAALGSPAISKASLQAFVERMDTAELERFKAKELIAWTEESGVNLSHEQRAHLIAYALEDFDAVRDIITGAVEARSQNH